MHSGNRFRQTGRLLTCFAESVATALLATIFVVFILQILFRYLLSWPVGWTLEVSTLAWMWLVLWGSAFVVRESDEIRFDILSSAVADRVRRGFVIFSSLVLVLIMIVSTPDNLDYVSFMRVEHVSYIRLRLDYVFSIYILFSLAIVIRYLILAWSAFRNPDKVKSD